MSQSIEEHHDAFYIKKACDQCRKRKIRCDRESPCSSCVTAGYACSVGAIRRREAKPKVFVTNEYERKMDIMSNRLRNIENALLRLTTAPSSLSVSGSASPKPDLDIATRAWSEPLGGSDDMRPNGDVTLWVQTLQASDFLENAVSQGRVRERNPLVHAALVKLRELVRGERRWSARTNQGGSRQPTTPEGGLQNLPLPPYNVTMSVLNEVQTGEPTMFVYNSSLVGIADLSQLVGNVYNSPQTATHAELTVVNGSLHTLFAEQSAIATDATLQTEYQSYSQTCQSNLEILIKHFPLFQPPSMINIQALTVSMSYSVDSCRPAVAWQLNSQAVQLCQDGGFHRAECADENPETRRIKSNLFWHAFVMDKCLSLRLGRTSMVEDWDITIAKKLDLDTWNQSPDTDVPKAWLLTSPLRARTYELLYSREARSASPTEVLRRATHLAKECVGLELEMANLKANSSAGIPSEQKSGLINLYALSSRVQFYVTTTFIYRMIPGPGGSGSQFCDKCLESSRDAIRCHLSGITTLDNNSYLKSAYVSWTLMLTPFAPFFILFCHVIETLHMDDLQLLRAFSESLESLRDASDTAQKLFNLCRTMCDVACAYQEDVWQSDPAQAFHGDFNGFLGQMGLEAPDNRINLSEELATSEITDWFFGGRSTPQ